jgi:hypothetical protein
VTDLPRRSYPLVVPPPGGFEDAVHRGRKRRRKQAGGSTGVALVFVGALAYSLVGHSSSTNSLDSANDTHVNETRPTPGAGASNAPVPQASATGAVPGTGGRPAGATGPRGIGPSAVPSVSFSPPPARKPNDPAVRRYAVRPVIARHEGQTNTSTECLSSQQSQDWCTSAYATPNQTTPETYTFTYTVCRSVRAASAILHFPRDDKHQVDFAARDVAHDDTVWTHSADRAAKSTASTVRVDPGYCVFWDVTWNGYDDFGDNPAGGAYELTARSFSTETLPPAKVASFTHA